MTRSGAGARGCGRQQPASRYEDLDVLFHAVECCGAAGLRAPDPRAARATHDPEGGISTIREALAQIAELGGVQKACYIRGAKALVKGDIKRRSKTRSCGSCAWWPKPRSARRAGWTSAASARR
jgi:hypothetical protein